MHSTQLTAMGSIMRTIMPFWPILPACIERMRQPWRVRTKGLAAKILAAASIALLSACAVRPMARPPSPVPQAAPVINRPAPAPAEPSLSASPAPLPQVENSVPQAPPALTADNAEVLRTWVSQQRRLYRIAAPLLINNTDLCPRHARPILGFTAKNKYSYTSHYADVAETALGLDEQLRVINLFPGSSAEHAGMREGDILLVVEIEPIPQGPDAEHKAASLIASEMQGRSSLQLTVLRDGERMTMDVAPTPACAMTIDLGNTDSIGSYSDGRRVLITRGMLNFVQSDEELGYVLAKEIARNIIAPGEHAEVAAIIDRLHTIGDPVAMDFSAGISRVSANPDADASVDELALYLLVRAGYGIDNFPSFWSRLSPSPLAANRVSSLDQMIKTIRAKQEMGLPLMPQSTVTP